MTPVLGAALIVIVFAACRERPDVARSARKELTAETRIGSETNGAEYQFTTIAHVVATSDNVYVVQRDAPEIRVYRNDGGYVRTIGRQGGGPGEVQSIWSMGIVGDSLWVIDVDLRRLTFFTLDGTLISTVPFEPVPPSLGQPGARIFLPYPQVLMREGDFLGFGLGTGSALADGIVAANPLMRMNTDGHAADTLGWVSVKNDDMILRSDKSRMFRPQPFSDTPITVFGAAARRAYVVERWAATESNAGSVRATAIDASGDTAWVREISYTPARLDPGRIADVRSQLEKGLARYFSREEINRALYAPMHRTPVTSAVAAEGGALWIRWDSLTTRGSYSVIQADGRDVISVSASPRIRLRWVSDSTAWGEELDENDVPTLVRYRVKAAASPTRR